MGLRNCEPQPICGDGGSTGGDDWDFGLCGSGWAGFRAAVPDCVGGCAGGFGIFAVSRTYRERHFGSVVRVLCDLAGSDFSYEPGAGGIGDGEKIVSAKGVRRTPGESRDYACVGRTLLSD